MRLADYSHLVGRQFDGWTVLNSGIPGKHRKLSCRCRCGAQHEVGVHNLLRGLSRGCIKCRRFVGNQNPGWNGYEDIPGNLFGILKKSAEIRGIEVEITIQDLQELWEKQGGKCALSGQQLKLCSKKFGITASVDRINQKLGYTRSNIQWVHKDVNLMKNRFDEEYFIDVCRKIVDTAGG